MKNRWLWMGIVFVALLALYVHTLMPGTVGGDAGELQYAGPILALTHPTGLPLYIFVGYLWSQLVNIGTVAYRMNLLAAVSGALGSAIMMAMLYRIYARLIIAVACGFTLGVGSTFWGQAVLADKYAFNTIWVTLVTGLALLWAKEHDQPHGNRLLYMLAAIYGVSLLHHRTMLLFAFGLGFLVLYHERWVIWHNKRRTIICLALVLLPALIVYPIFLPWIQSRELAPSEWQPQTAGQWIEWLMDRQEAKEAFVTSGVGAQLESYTNTLLNDYTAIVILIAIFGLIILARHDVGSAFLLGFTYLIQGGLAANWRDNDRPFTYFLPSFIIVIYAYGHGLYILWEIISRWFNQKHPQWKYASGGILSVVVIGVLAVQFSYAYPIRYEDASYGKPLDLWRTTIKTGNMGERLASGMKDLPENAVLLTDWEQVTILWYYQKVEAWRPDIEINYPIDRKFGLYENSGRDICISRNINPNDVSNLTWHPTAYDALICLQRQPTIIESLDELPARVSRVGKMLYDRANQPQLELAGYWIETTVFEAGHFEPLVISWRALADLEADYAISLRLMREDWTEYAHQDILNPVTGMYPTSRWVKNELVHDYHELNIDPDMPPNNYFWAVIVYRRLENGDFENLHEDGGSEVIFGGTFQVVE